MAGHDGEKELRQRIGELEVELRSLRESLHAVERSESLLREAAHMALLGHWELDLVTNSLFWSDEIYSIFELDPLTFGATYEAFLATVHPDDRAAVDRAYAISIREKKGYDIVHRLLLRDGAIRYVHEKCATEYDDDGEPSRSIGTVQDITDQMHASQTHSSIVGREPCMMEVLELIGQVCDVNVPVLVMGESGTGKELVASAIHFQGPRASTPCVPVNCGALPEGLLESELFGHVRGAFTGAMKDKKGRFELAHEGTLFLDEVGDLPKPMQVKLLRVLQDGCFERLGDEKTLEVDVRIVSATNRDLKAEVQKGDFREDLYYRLNVVPIRLPPLRARRNDIALLVEHFLDQAARDGQHNTGISPRALALLMDHSWPGNVRELESSVRYALLKSGGASILPEHLPGEIREPAGKQHAAPSMKGRFGRRGASPQKPPVVRTPGRARKLDPAAVSRALQRSGGNKAMAARILGVGRATLYRYLESMGVLGGKDAERG